MKNVLKVTTPGDREIVMTRMFNAPRRLVWDAMTKPDLIRKWLFLPPGWEMSMCEEDVRVGGKYRWAWKDGSQSGQEAMAMHGTYRIVEPPREGGAGGKMVRTETFEFGCAPQAGEQLATIEMIEAGDATMMKITVVYPSKEARDGAIKSGMEKGVSTGYDNLERMLEGNS